MKAGDNLANIDNIMTYIKSQFEHVIIISHLDALKNQSDHIINITKKRGYLVPKRAGKGGSNAPSHYSHVDNINRNKLIKEKYEEPTINE